MVRHARQDGLAGRADFGLLGMAGWAGSGTWSAGWHCWRVVGMALPCLTVAMLPGRVVAACMGRIVVRPCGHIRDRDMGATLVARRRGPGSVLLRPQQEPHRGPGVATVGPVEQRPPPRPREGRPQ
jgi:hypothetical protein